MNTSHLARVRRLFASPTAPRSTQRHNMREWVRSMRILGTRWQLHPQSTYDARPVKERT